MVITVSHFVGEIDEEVPKITGGQILNGCQMARAAPN